MPMRAQHQRCKTEPCQAGWQVTALQKFQQECALSAVAAAAVTAIMLNASTALASEDLTITFRASRNPDIGRVQRALVEAWGASMLCVYL